MTHCFFFILEPSLYKELLKSVIFGKETRQFYDLTRFGEKYG